MTQTPHPNLFLIGAQKSGTSTLNHLLVQHPEICNAGSKELNIFHAPDSATARARLGERFRPRDPDASFVLDASVNYTRRPRHPHAPGNIRELCGSDVRFIYVMRNPVDRLISNYLYSGQKYGVPGSLEQTVQADPQMIDTGRYDFQLEPFLEAFPRERFLFLKFDDLSAKPQDTAYDVFSWLGLDALQQLTVTIKNKTAKKPIRMHPAVVRGLLSTNMSRRLISRLFSDKTKRRLAQAFAREGALMEPPRTFKVWLMQTHYVDSIRRTQALTGLSLEDWIATYSN